MGGKLQVQPGRTAILVVGMHRGGTSAVTRVLNLLGAQLPDNLMVPLETVNPKGFWESIDIADANDRCLEELGLRWDDSRAMPSNLLEVAAAEELRDRARDLLARDFKSGDLIVLKDPRFSRVLPVWRRALEVLGFAVRVLIICRHPLEVAASLRLRDGFSREKSMRLWLRHLLDAEIYSRDLPRLWITFDQVLEDWQGCLQPASAWIKGGWPRPPEEARAEIQEFLTKGLRHHERCPEDLGDGISPWILEGYELIHAMTTGDETIQVEGRFDKLRNRFEGAERLFYSGPAAAYSEGTVELTEKLGRELRMRSNEAEARLFERERLYSELRQKTAALEEARLALSAAETRHRRWLQEFLEATTTIRSST